MGQKSVKLKNEALIQTEREAHQPRLSPSLLKDSLSNAIAQSFPYTGHGVNLRTRLDNIFLCGVLG